MIAVRLEPCDVVFFRDDLPFGAAGTQVARSQFPPRPSVVAGALRTKVLADHHVDFDAFRRGDDVPPAVGAEIGWGRGATEDVATGSFRLVRLALGHRSAGGVETTYHRVGRDLLRLGKGGPTGPDMRLVAPTLGGRPPGSSSLGSLAVLRPALGFEAVGGWLGAEAYRDYVLGSEPDERPLGDDHVVAWDDRVGIGLDSASRTVDEGRLFSTRGVILRDGWGFVVGVEGCSTLRAEGLVRLGGDGRMARVEPWEGSDPDWTPVRERVADSGRFRWVLQTPAIFASGWLPGTVRETSEGPVLVADAFQARLVAASIGTPELAGGWDLVRGRPKPFRRTVPAGGVYWFEVVEGDRSAPWAAYHDRSVSDERAHEGYGLVHVGGWDYALCARICNEARVHAACWRRRVAVARWTLRSRYS